MQNQNPKREPKNEINWSITLTPEQKKAKGEILEKPFNFILGKAGSGKTIISCAIALDLLFKKQIDHIIISRPTVSTEDNGFLPGSLEEADSCRYRPHLWGSGREDRSSDPGLGFPRRGVPVRPGPKTICVRA